MSTTPPKFRKSSFSDNNAQECIEVAGTLDAARDSKNPAGPTLTVRLDPLLSAIKSGHFDR